MNFIAYIDVLQENSIPWNKKKRISFKKSLIFIQDNALSHTAKLTLEFLEKKGFKENKLMTWSGCSPDLNPIENLWAIQKYRLYQSGRQFPWMDQHWEEIMECASQITQDETQNLTKSMDKRLFSVIQKNGAYIKH